MKKVRKWILFIVAILVILSAGVFAFAPHSPAIPAQVTNVTEMESYFNQLVESGNPPGLSVVVVEDGRLVYKHAFGYADRPLGKKSTPDTVYHWWSMTKIPTAIAIMQLQEQGKLNLDDAVTMYLPWFKVNNSSGKHPVAPLSVVYNFIIEGNDKIVGFNSMRRRKSPLNEGFTGNPCDSDLMF